MTPALYPFLTLRLPTNANADNQRRNLAQCLSTDADAGEYATARLFYAETSLDAVAKAYKRAASQGLVAIDDAGNGSMAQYAVWRVPAEGLPADEDIVVHTVRGETKMVVTLVP